MSERHESATVTPVARVLVDVYPWASQLSSESRLSGWTEYSYVWPDEVRQISHRLECMEGGIIGLVGIQGVGKSSALLAIATSKMIEEDEIRARSSENSGRSAPCEYRAILFKWRRRNELFQSLLNGSHEVSGDFRHKYCRRLFALLEPRIPLPNLEELKECPERLNVDWAEKKLGRTRAKSIREALWHEMLCDKKAILIDTPDYSKTDRRLMARDLGDILAVEPSRLLRQEAKPGNRNSEGNVPTSLFLRQDGKDRTPTTETRADA